MGGGLSEEGEGGNFGGFFEIFGGVSEGEEARFELGRGEVDAVIEAEVEVAGEGSAIAVLGIGEVMDWAVGEIEAEHGADALEEVIAS